MRPGVIAAVIGVLAALSQAQAVANDRPAAPHEVKRELAAYPGSGGEVPVLIVAPAAKGSYPVLLYIAGRHGLTEPVAQYLDAVAERGIVVVAPDYQFNRAIPALASFSDTDAIDDLKPVLPFIDTIKDRYTSRQDGKVGILAQDHGGYFGILLSTDQPERIGALIGLYPLLQDPKIHKTQQLYAFATQVEDLVTPTLVLLGKNEREIRRFQAERVTSRLEALKRTAVRIELPGAQRCFDWRVDKSNIGDTAARQESLDQIVRFLTAHLRTERLLVLGKRGWEIQ